MARSGTLAGVVLALLLTVHCSSDQPLGSGAQIMRVIPFSASATYPLLCYQDVWDVYQDLNQNGQPDPGECVGIECGDYSCPGVGGGTRAVPWPYTVEIVVIRSGQVVRTVVTPSAAGSSLISMTSGDAEVAVNQSPPPPATPGRFHLNPRAFPETSAEWTRWCSGFLNVPTPNLAGGSDPASPAICDSTTPIPWDVQVQSGDTVIVSAGFSRDALGPYGVPNFVGSMTLDGRQVTPSGLPDGNGVGAHLSFSYTVR